MGYGYCRFGCGKGTNIDYDILLSDMNIRLFVCGMWEHYAKDHNVSPPVEARDAVMRANPTKATIDKLMYMGECPKRLEIYFVEKSDGSYNHKIGDSPDTKFIDKLKKIIYSALGE